MLYITLDGSSQVLLPPSLCGRKNGDQKERYLGVQYASWSMGARTGSRRASSVRLNSSLVRLGMVSSPYLCPVRKGNVRNNQCNQRERNRLQEV